MNKCPQCGAARTMFDGQCSWKCGSYLKIVDGPALDWQFVQSEQCRLTVENAMLKDEQRRLADIITERNSEISELEAQIVTLNELQSVHDVISADERWEADLRTLVMGWRARALNERAFSIDEDATPSLRCSEELAAAIQRNTTTKTTNPVPPTEAGL